MSHWHQRLSEYRSFAQIARRQLEILPGLIITAFLPSAIGALIATESFFKLPHSIVLLAAAASLVMAMIGLFYVYRISSVAGAAISARQHTEATFEITNPKLVEPTERNETSALQKQYRFRYFYYSIFAVQMLFSANILYKAL